jgi:NitT/TauT family transport system ATP-binding protein
MLSKLQVVTDPSPAQISQRPLLDVAGVTLQYKTTEYLVTATSQVSFDIHAGDRFVLLGPSGCGKSTLLKAIAGFIKPVEGKISLKDRQIEAPGPDRMMVFQEFDQLLPWKTVRQNIELPLRLNKRADVARSTEEIIERVGLTKFADAYPHTLSGGMKQRVAIARAMAMKPDVLLMDEPYAALDALTRRKMQHELLQLWDKTGFTLIFVTHSIEEAVLIGSRILVLSPHPGRVRAELNAHQFGPESQGGPEFQALCKKIHDMLFEH